MIILQDTVKVSNEDITWRPDVDPAPARVNWYWSESKRYSLEQHAPTDQGLREIHPHYIINVNEGGITEWSATEW